MKKTIKKSVALLATGAFLACGAAALWQEMPAAFAKGKDAAIGREMKQPHCYRGKHHGHHSRHSGQMHERISPREASQRLAKAFGLDAAEFLEAQNDGRSKRDIFHGALVAKTGKRSFAETIKLKTDANRWSDVEAQLGVKPEELRAVRLDMKAERVAARLSLDKKVAKELLADRYKTHDIAGAAIVARLSGNDIKAVLGQKKINNSWHDVAKLNNVDDGKFREAMREIAPHFGGPKMKRHSPRHGHRMP